MNLIILCLQKLVSQYRVICPQMAGVNMMRNKDFARLSGYAFSNKIIIRKSVSSTPQYLQPRNPISSSFLSYQILRLLSWGQTVNVTAGIMASWNFPSPHLRRQNQNLTLTLYLGNWPLRARLQPQIFLNDASCITASLCQTHRFLNCSEEFLQQFTCFWIMYIYFFSFAAFRVCYDAARIMYIYIYPYIYIYCIYPLWFLQCGIFLLPSFQCTCFVCVGLYGSWLLLFHLLS